METPCTPSVATKSPFDFAQGRLRRGAPSSILVVTALALLAGCLTPRSAGLMQTAAPVGPGAIEVGVATGFAYQSELGAGSFVKDPTGKDFRSQTLSRGFSLPAFEANGQIGVSEMVAVNVHASSAGIQPGAKITLNRGFGQVALLPEIAFGYGSSASSTFLTGQDGRQNESSPNATTSLNFLAGLKILASHRMGLYGGLGYDLQLGNAVTTGTTGVGGATQPTLSSISSVQHNFTGAIGFDWPLGQVHLRPELAAVLTPAIFLRNADLTGAAVDSSGGVGFLIMPTLTLAVASDPKREDAGLIQDEEQIGNTRGEDEEVPPSPEEQRRERERRREEEENRRDEDVRDD